MKPDFMELLQTPGPRISPSSPQQEKEKQNISVGEESSSLSVSFSIKTTGQSALGTVGVGAG